MDRVGRGFGEDMLFRLFHLVTRTLVRCTVHAVDIRVHISRVVVFTLFRQCFCRWILADENTLHCFGLPSVHYTDLDFSFQDTIWIESMNSVMDMNKTLTLASNERIPLKPHMRMLFEMRDLAHASLATVRGEWRCTGF